MSGHGGSRLGAGRPRGSKNKVALEVRELALQHGPAALLELVKLSKKAKSESVRLAASREILDRAYGRAAQSAEINNEELSPRPIPRSEIVRRIMEILNIPEFIEVENVLMLISSVRESRQSNPKA